MGAVALTQVLSPAIRIRSGPARGVLIGAAWGWRRPRRLPRPRFTKSPRPRPRHNGTGGRGERARPEPAATGPLRGDALGRRTRRAGEAVGRRKRFRPESRPGGTRPDSGARAAEDEEEQWRGRSCPATAAVLPGAVACGCNPSTLGSKGRRITSGQELKTSLGNMVLGDIR
ncbi:hypothetical protein H8959_008021 [Pygathrix nigripes]